MSSFNLSRVRIVIFNILVLIIYVFIVVKNAKEFHILDIILLTTMPFISYVFMKKYTET
ncbi:MAG: hypothetical protein QW775_00920 [Ignisphaera sp.]